MSNVKKTPTESLNDRIMIPSLNDSVILDFASGFHENAEFYEYKYIPRNLCSFQHALLQLIQSLQIILLSFPKIRWQKMKNLKDIIIPYIGIEVDITPVLHIFRDFVFTLILWQIGFRDFQAAFTVMLISGFWEGGNGICYNSDGTHCHFDILDFLPSVFVGFLTVGVLSRQFDFSILLKLGLVYVLTITLLLLLNIILQRKFVYK